MYSSDYARANRRLWPARDMVVDPGILVGHTIVDTITPLYDGKVIAVQVSMHRDEQNRPIAEGLRIDRGRFYRATIDGQLEPLDRLPRRVVLASSGAAR